VITEGFLVYLAVLKVRGMMYRRGRHGSVVSRCHRQVKDINPLIATLKMQSNGPSYSNTVIGTMAVDGGMAAALTGPSSLYEM